MEREAQTRYRNLVYEPNGTVFEIPDELVVLDQHLPVDVSIMAFQRMSAPDVMISTESLLSTNTLRSSSTYSSRNIVVISLPRVGYVWCTRFRVELPPDVVNGGKLETDVVGSDFLFFWSPQKACSSYLTISECTRKDGRTRWLTNFDPTPKNLIMDWPSALEGHATPVPVASLTRAQRFFVASLVPTPHLSMPRHKTDLYIVERHQEVLMKHDSAPIQIKFRRLLSGAVTPPPTSSPLSPRDVNVTTERRTMTASRFFNHDEVIAPPRPNFEGTSIWEDLIDSDIEHTIVGIMADQVMNVADEKQMVLSMLTLRSVSKGFKNATDYQVHTRLTQAKAAARSFIEGGTEMPLSTRDWWNYSRLPVLFVINYSVPDKSQSTILLCNWMHKNAAVRAYPVSHAKLIRPTASSRDAVRSAMMHELTLLASAHPRFRDAQPFLDP